MSQGPEDKPGSDGSRPDAQPQATPTPDTPSTTAAQPTETQPAASHASSEPSAPPPAPAPEQPPPGFTAEEWAALPDDNPPPEPQSPLDRRLVIMRFVTAGVVVTGAAAALGYIWSRRRSARPYTGLSDQDPTDPEGYGRPKRRVRLLPNSDNDPTDPEGQGRNFKGKDQSGTSPPTPPQSGNTPPASAPSGTAPSGNAPSKEGSP